MGLCSKCRDFFPPDFINDGICDFCKEGSNTIMNKEGILYTKREVMEDYRIFLGKLKDSKDIQNVNFESMVRQGMKNE